MFNGFGVQIIDLQHSNLGALGDHHASEETQRGKAERNSSDVFAAARNKGHQSSRKPSLVDPEDGRGEHLGPEQEPRCHSVLSHLSTARRFLTAELS